VEIAHCIIAIYNYAEPEVHPPEMQFDTVLLGFASEPVMQILHTVN